MVHVPLAMLERTKPATPPAVKITTSRAVPKSCSTAGASWRTHRRLKTMWSRLPWR